MALNLLLLDPSIRPTITVPEAGALLGLSRVSAYLAAERGDIPTIRIGRRLLVPTEALRRLLGMIEPPALPRTAADVEPEDGRRRE